VIVDEPTVGLHPSDIDRLVVVFDRLVERGNSVIVVSHDMAVAAAADWVIDLGPGPGEAGGRVVAAGPPEQVAAAVESRTARYLGAVLAGRPAVVPAREPRRSRKSSRLAEPNIAVRGARQHNLKRIDVEVPRGKITVVTGPSGSGKSTLAFDVIHAEGQRRYLQSLSPFVRQYLPQLPRPEVDAVDGVPPSIALEPRTSTSGGATVATLTEVGHYLRLLYARVGVQRCPDCGVEARSRTPAEIRAAVTAVAATGSVSLLARAVQHRKGTHKDVFAKARGLGFSRVRVDGELHDVARPPKLDRYHEHDLDLEVALLEVGAAIDAAVVDRALQLGAGTLRLLSAGGGEKILSVRRSCPSCGRGFGELDPTMFSHHSRYSACPACHGSGVEAVFDEALVIDGERPLGKGGLRLFELPMFRRSLGRRLRRIRTIPLERRFSELTDSQRRSLVEGRGGWPGLATAVERLAEQGVAAAEAMLRRHACRECGGDRLAAQPRNVVLGAGGPDPRSIGALTSLPVSQARRWMEALALDARGSALGDDLRRQVVRRLSFLEETGVGYLTLDRPSETLSGGETQRVRLAAQLGADLSGVCYVLDEPTVGLHPRDTMRLVGILRKLADSGSTMLVVEHDEQTIRAADHVIDLGPGGGTAGGTIVATGRPEAIERTPSSPTGRALARSGAEARVARRETSGAPWLEIEGASARNLRDLSVAIPLGRLTAFTGVSGSGKSTLVREVLFRALRQALGLVNEEPPGAFRRISGFEPLQRAIEIDQSPIGRTPRSVPATYIDIWGDVRRLLARTPEARARGYGPDRFSFNRAGGRCEACEGQGSLKIEMSFLPEVQAWCEGCQGTRFDGATREVTYRGLSVDRILALTAEEAAGVFEPFPRIAAPLVMMCDLGIGYLTLGQPSNTLSGGEAQRLKLAAELRTRASGATLYVLDEPTTGLHALDVDRLIAVLQRLVDRGDTVVVIEHHTSVIWAADHVVDLGPEGGDGGGRVVVSGTPVVVRDHASSYTGAALQRFH
jgi:excinuclease ABC subunit A